jgi:hypothetical protein
MSSILNINAKFYHLPDQTALPKSRLAKAFHYFKEVAKDDDARSGTLKTARAALSLHEALVGSDSKDIRAAIGFATDALKVFNIPATIATLIKERKNKIKTAINSLDLIGGVFSGFRILDYFKAIDLGVVANTMGKIPVIGVQAAKILPFTNIVNIVDIVRSSIAIHQARKEIKSEKKKKSQYADKKTEWGKIQTSGKIDKQFIVTRLNTSLLKRSKAYEEKKTAESKMTDALKKFTKCVTKHESLLKILQSCSTSEKLRLKWKTYRAFGKARRAKNEYEKAVKQFQAQTVKWDKYDTKVKNWNEFENKIKSVNQPVESVKKLAELKVEKWDRKTVKSNKLIRDNKISIGLKTASIIVMVASMVLTFLALSTISFVAIPLAVALLAIVVIGTGIAIWKKVRKDVTYKAVPISMIWERQGAVPQQVPA